MDITRQRTVCWILKYNNEPGVTYDINYDSMTLQLILMMIIISSEKKIHGL